MTAKQKEPIRAESMLWTTANMVKAIYLTGVACSLYFGLTAKFEQIIARQDGRDNVQDIRIEQNMNSISDLRFEIKQVVSREGIKPKPISIITEK